ncbi:MAG: DUF3800 domain-containing protein [Planctomycetes bacterium]|nr:DUF3800 domain-containing protein [Planctomycetota bacterium]
MYLLYVDESGDPGPRGKEDFLVLSGLVVHETQWPACFRMVKDLRVALRDQFGIRRNQELHASNNIAGRGALWGRRWPVSERLRLFQLVLETASQMPGVRCINVCVRKVAQQFASQKGHRVYETAWRFLLQRFHNYVEEARRRGAVDSGMVVHDVGHEVEIRKLMRKLRVYNYVPSKYGAAARNIPLLSMVEDPVPRDSYHAQFVQVCDYMAYALLRRESPVPRYPGLEAVFDILQPILLREAARDDPDGVVRYPKM